MKDEEKRLLFIRENYDRLGRRGCAEALGITRPQVDTITVKYGISMNPEAKRKLQFERSIKPHDQYSVNPDMFMSVTTPEAAYILGVIWADGTLRKPKGYVMGVSITQVKSDMYDISRTLNVSGRWCYLDKPKVNHCQLTSMAFISNRVLAEYLAKHGYAAKSQVSADSILATIPEHLKHYWFRGLFDGDGCLSFHPSGEKGVKWGVFSSYAQDWSYLESLCKNLRIGYYKVQNTLRSEMITGRHNRGSKFTVCRHMDVRVLMAYIYQGRENDGIGIKRKWDKWCEFKRIQPKRSNNRYPGITCPWGRWQARITKSLGASEALLVGYFNTEEEAYAAQQKQIAELGILSNRDREYGRHYQVANQTLGASDKALSVLMA